MCSRPHSSTHSPSHACTIRLDERQHPLFALPLDKVANVQFYITLHPTVKRTNVFEIKSRIPQQASLIMEATSKEDGFRWLTAFQQADLDCSLV